MTSTSCLNKIPSAAFPVKRFFTGFRAFVYVIIPLSPATLLSEACMNEKREKALPKPGALIKEVLILTIAVFIIAAAVFFGVIASLLGKSRDKNG